MSLVDRAKNIILTPKTEWPVIETEEPDTGALITGYALPLMLIPVIATVAAFGLFASFALTVGIAVGLATLITSLIGIILSAIVVNALASSFNSVPNQGRAFQLVIYSATAGWVTGVLIIIPFLGWLAMIAGGLYGIYLIYLGLPHLMKTPEDKRVIYVVVALVVNMVVQYVVGGMIKNAMLGAFGYSGVLGV